MPTESQPRPWWHHLRGVLVLLHIIAVVSAAAPAPVGGLQRVAWATPVVQAELDAWHTRLDKTGLVGDRQSFEDRLYDLARRWVKARRAALEPFQPYYRMAGTDQSWRMFVAPHTHPARLHIEVKTTENGPWEVIYEQGSATATWHAHQLRYSRVRPVLFRYAWPRYRGHYRALVRWAAREVARERPDATELRAYWARQKTPSAAQVRRGIEPPTKQQSVVTIDLSELTP